jgi:Fe2+ transport system protein FeoA
MDASTHADRRVGPSRATASLHLGEIPLGEVVELEGMDLPEADVESLLERGLLPGCELCPIRLSPFGDPIVKVEGTVLALRREMACCLRVRRRPAA